MPKSVEFSVGSVKLTISFDTPEELKTALGDVEEIKKILKEKLPEASTEPSRVIRKDLEGICDYHDGKLIMLRAPDSKGKKVCLALYAIDADGATPKEIATISHVQNPSNSILHNLSYKKYFRKLTNGKYVLTDVGLSFVTGTILPELKEKEKGGTSQP